MKNMGKDHKGRNPLQKSNMHPRNKHRGQYDFELLVQSYEPLGSFVRPNPYGNLSVDFADSNAVKALNKALLLHFYSIEKWDIPEGYLCPPIPGRADYIHHIADLIACEPGEVPRGSDVRCLDIGVGANCIYPIIGRSEYEWSFVGTEIDKDAVKSAQQIVSDNSILRDSVEVRLQSDKSNVLTGAIVDTECFDVVICNPPFHGSPEEARAGTTRKLRNLNRGKRKTSKRLELNFSGKVNELCYDGGEIGFITNLIKESVTFKDNCRWFTALVSKESSLTALSSRLKSRRIKNWRTIEMGQGNKKSRILAWTFKSV